MRAAPHVGRVQSIHGRPQFARSFHFMMTWPSGDCSHTSGLLMRRQPLSLMEFSDRDLITQACSEGETEDFGLLSHSRRRRQFLRHPILPRHAKPVRRFLYARGPLIAALHVALPPSQRTFAQRDCRARAVLARTGLDRFGNQCHHCYPLWQRGHLPSSSQSARNFFCRISNAAASVSALSLRSTSRCSLSLSSFWQPLKTSATSARSR